MRTMAATAIEQLASAKPGYREQLEDAIRAERAELGAYAAIAGAVWQEMRDRWAALVRHHRACYGPPVCLAGGYLPSGSPGPARGLLIA